MIMDICHKLRSTLGHNFHQTRSTNPFLTLKVFLLLIHHVTLWPWSLTLDSWPLTLDLWPLIFDPWPLIFDPCPWPLTLGSRTFAAYRLSCDQTLCIEFQRNRTIFGEVIAIQIRPIWGRLPSWIRPAVDFHNSLDSGVPQCTVMTNVNTI